MAERKPEYPEPGDLVNVTIETVTDSGAYAKIDEHSKRELCVNVAPQYNVEVTADNWKRAEELLQKVSQVAVTNVTKANGQGSFRREK